MEPSITYKAQRFGTNAWLDFNLPVTTDGPQHVFSTYETLSATIAPEIGNRLAEDGKPMLWKWGTWVHVETPDERIWTGIVDEVWADGAVLHVRAREWQGYLHGLTYQGQIWAVRKDPADVVRQLVDDIQKVPGADLGVTVVGSVPGKLLGTHWDDTVILRKREFLEADDRVKYQKEIRTNVEQNIKREKAKHDRLIDPKAKLLEPLVETYRSITKQKDEDLILSGAKQVLEEFRDGKKTDPVIVAYKAKSEQKNRDDLLRTRKWAYDDEVELKNIDASLANLKADYEQKRAAKAPAAVVKAAKAAYDVRRLYWDNRLKPFKTAYEQRRDYWDNQLKPLKRPHDVRVVHWDPMIRDAEHDYTVRVEYWDTRLAPSRSAKEKLEAEIAVLREARSKALEPFEELLEYERALEDALGELADAAKTVLQEAEDNLRLHGGAYKVLRQDHPDAWGVLVDLSRVGGFDFTTETVKTHGAPILRLIIHPGRVGTTRDDLVFEQGRNIISQPEIREPDEYASEVIAVGAGQGEDLAGIESSLQKSVAVVDTGRMYRNALAVDPSITNTAVLDVVAREQLKRLRTGFFLPEITVKDDPNAPIGAWRAGDIITPRMHSVPHFGAVSRKMRVRSWQRIGVNKAKLFLEEP